MNDYLTAKGWLTIPERDLLKQLAAEVPADGHILNVGIEYGASLHCLRAGNEHVVITAIDIIGREKLEGDPQVNSIIQGDSGLYARRWMSPLHLAFIDGDHTFRGVFLDCLYADHVVMGGVIAFHDCYAWEGGEHKTCPEVGQAVSAWFEENQDEWQELETVDSIRLFRRVAL